MTNGKVQCRNCGNNVVPRLWHRDMNSIMVNRSSQHICPICGVTMYRTGGELSILGSLGAGFAALLLIIGILTILFSMFGFSGSISFILALASLIVFSLWLYNKQTGVIERKWKKIKSGNW